MIHKGHSIRKIITKTAAAGLFALTLLGCPPPIVPPEPAPATEQNKLSEDTHIIGQDEIASIYSVSNNSMTVSNPSSYYINKIVVSDISDKTPEGLFRKVTSVSGNIVYTVPATFEEAIQNTSFETDKAIRFSLSSHPRLALNIFDFNQPIENLTIYDFDGNDATLDDRALLNGNVSLNSNLYLKINISDNILKNFVFKNTSSDSVDLQFTSNLEKPDIDSKKDFKEFVLPSIRLGYLPTTPPLPIIVTPVITITGGLGGNVSISSGAGITQRASLGIGLSYDKGSWSTIKEFTNNFDYQLPTFSSLNSLKAYLGPTINFLFYGVAGPYAGINAYLKLDSNTNSGKLFGGLEFLLGVQGKIFGMNFADYSTTLPGKEIQLASWEKPTPPEKLERLLFVMGYSSIPPYSPDYPQIYSVNTDGSSLTKISNFSQFFSDFNPSTSSDGKKISYTSKQNGNLDIYTMNIDGTNITQLTSDTADDFHPDLSPDGTKIVFVTHRVKGYPYRLYTMNSDGSNVAPVIGAHNISFNPRWSYDGRKIIFSSYDGLYIVEGNSSEQKVPGTSSSDSFPSFSSDGREILFVSARDKNPEVYIMNADGSNQVNLTKNPASDFDPNFSPDGKRIVFASYRGDGWVKIYTMNKDGSGVKNVPTTNYTYSSSPRYIPLN